MKQGFFNYLKSLSAILVVQFAFYLVIGIVYDWLLISLKFQNEFSWNLVFLITFSLMIFSLVFPRAYNMPDMRKGKF
jgi:hypothetical protein